MSCSGWWNRWVTTTIRGVSKSKPRQTGKSGDTLKVWLWLKNPNDGQLSFMWTRGDQNPGFLKACLLPVELHLTWWRFDPPGDPSLIKNGEQKLPWASGKSPSYGKNYVDRAASRASSTWAHIKTNLTKCLNPLKLTQERSDVTLRRLVDNCYSDGERTNQRQRSGAPAQVSLALSPWARLSSSRNISSCLENHLTAVCKPRRAVPERGRS